MGPFTWSPVVFFYYEVPGLKSIQVTVPRMNIHEHHSDHIYMNKSGIDSIRKKTEKLLKHTDEK